MLKKIPHTYTIIFSIILLCAVLSWIIPAGEYSRHTVEVNGTTRSVIVDNSYHAVESVPQTWDTVKGTAMKNAQRKHANATVKLAADLVEFTANANVTLNVNKKSITHLTIADDKEVSVPTGNILGAYTYEVVGVFQFQYIYYFHCF